MHENLTQQVVLDMYMTAGVGVFALLLGLALTWAIPALKRFCIPAPVSGGLIISLLILLLHSMFRLEFSFDGTIRDICMMLFFTSVGFQSDLRVLRKGGKPLVVMVVLVAVLITLQNVLSVGLSTAMHVNPLVGMAAGSISMAGGHGTSGGFYPILASMGLEGADSITMAAATFGLVAGSLIGGPLGERLVRRHHLSEESSAPVSFKVVEDTQAADDSFEEPEDSRERAMRNYTWASCQLIIAMALGMVLSRMLSKTGITFPTYFGALIVAAVIRNIFPEREGRNSSIRKDEISAIGNICLSLFLGIAMATLKLWELSGLMVSLLVILLAQTVLIILYATLVAFPALGKNYDAAVLVSGLCGFGLGATPNAMANMSAVCYKYHYAVQPFIIVPIIGAMFVDIINTGIITLFLNWL